MVSSADDDRRDGATVPGGHSEFYAPYGKWPGCGTGAKQAVYFGDDNDDIEPIRRCGYGVAVSNALDCVKAVADEVAESNDEDGVARTLARLWTRG